MRMIKNKYKFALKQPFSSFTFWSKVKAECAAVGIFRIQELFETENKFKIYNILVVLEKVIKRFEDS